MGARTIPEPTAEDFTIAFSAMLVTAHAQGLDVSTNEQLLACFRQTAEVHAQMASEIRWLRNLLNPGGEAKRETFDNAMEICLLEQREDDNEDELRALGDLLTNTTPVLPRGMTFQEMFDQEFVEESFND